MNELFKCLGSFKGVAGSARHTTVYDIIGTAFADRYNVLALIFVPGDKITA